MTGGGRVIAETHAQALGDLFELVIFGNERLELAQTLGHLLFGGAELLKNGHGSRHGGPDMVYHTSVAICTTLRSKLALRLPPGRTEGLPRRI